MRRKEIPFSRFVQHENLENRLVERVVVDRSFVKSAVTSGRTSGSSVERGMARCSSTSRVGFSLWRNFGPTSHIKLSRSFAFTDRVAQSAGFRCVGT